MKVKLKGTNKWHPVKKKRVIRGEIFYVIGTSFLCGFFARDVEIKE